MVRYDYIAIMTFFWCRLPSFPVHCLFIAFNTLPAPPIDCCAPIMSAPPFLHHLQYISSVFFAFLWRSGLLKIHNQKIQKNQTFSRLFLPGWWLILLVVHEYLMVVLRIEWQGALVAPCLLLNKN